MATSTTRLSLRKPDPNPVTGDFVDAGADLNANWDKVDGAMPFFPCTSGTRPGSPFLGMQIHETDTGNCLYWNGTAWKQIYVIGQATRWSEALAATRALATDLVFLGKVTGDTQERFQVQADGKIIFGAGGATAPDTNIYRGAANQLKTDDDFVSTGSVTGTQFLSTIAAGYAYNQTVKFTATGAFTKASYPGIRGVIVEVQGGGGGGGGTGATGAGTVAAASGGGGGGYLRVFIPATTLGVSETVTIGAAGAGGLGTAAPSDGGSTTFGTLATALGGAQGESIAASSSSVRTQGGNAGATSFAGAGVVEMFARPGETGGSGGSKGTTATEAAPGGSSYSGGGGRVSAANSGGNGIAPVGGAYGAGGSGAWADVSQAAFNGGAGLIGVCYVHVLI